MKYYAAKKVYFTIIMLRKNFHLWKAKLFVFLKETAYTDTYALQQYSKYTRQKVQSGYFLIPGLSVYLDIFQIFYTNHTWLFKDKIYNRKWKSLILNRQNKTKHDNET